MFDVHLHSPTFILHSQNCRTLKESRKVCCRVLGFHRLITSEHSTHTHHDARRSPHDFLFMSFPGPFYRGPIFRGPLFPGTIFPGTNFPGTNFPGTKFPGTNFPGTIFPGTTFPGGHFSGIRLLLLNSTRTSFVFFYINITADRLNHREL